MGEVGEFFLRCFGAFDFDGIEPVLPERDVQRRADAAGRLARGAPASRSARRTRRGDTFALLPAESACCSPATSSSTAAHPIAWAGPVSNWIAACERILGNGRGRDRARPRPARRQGGVRELKAYFEYLYEQARVAATREGMTPLQAARVDLC